MPFPALDEARGKLDHARGELKAVFDEAGPDLDTSKVKSVEGDVVDWIRAKNDEIDGHAKEVERLEAVAKAAESQRAAEAGHAEPGAEPGAKGHDRPPRSIGELFTESKAYTHKQGSTGPEANLDVDLKALFETGGAGGAGWTPETTRTGRLVEYATAPIDVLDVIPSGNTTQQAVVYMEETTLTNAAAEIAEAAAYPESALALTEQSSPVRKIATYLPVTDEQLEDVPQARGYVNARLPFFLRQRLNTQVLVGNGTAPNLRGFNNVVGIQTQAKGTDPVPDAVYKAMVKVMTGTGQAGVSAVVMNPADWQDVRLLRTADGVYLWGSPSDSGPERIWGTRVVLSQAQTAGAALLGDFAGYSQLVTRRGIDVQVSNSHADYFINGKQAVRADVRVALVVYRPAAFCTVTGI